MDLAVAHSAKVGRVATDAAPLYALPKPALKETLSGSNVKGYKGLNSNVYLLL